MQREPRWLTGVSRPVLFEKLAAMQRCTPGAVREGLMPPLHMVTGRIYSATNDAVVLRAAERTEPTRHQSSSNVAVVCAPVRLRAPYIHRRRRRRRHRRGRVGFA